MRILTIVLILVLGGGFASTSGLTASAAGSIAPPTVRHSLLGIACPSVDACYAVGENGTILGTQDGGSTWRRLHSGTKGWLSSIACPAVSVCYVPVGGPCDEASRLSLLTTGDGGASWTSRSLPRGCPGFGLTCPTATTCFARAATPQSTTFYGTTDGGTSWQARGTIASDIEMKSLACPSVEDCYCGGDYALGRSTDGARTWHISRFFAWGSWCSGEIICVEFDDISCPSPSTCFAAGCCGGSGGVNDVIEATADGGRTWKRHLILLAQLGRIEALSCPSSTVCMAVGWAGRLAMTTDGGNTWQAGRITGPFPFSALACPGATVCYAAGYLGRLMGTVDDGKIWRDLLPGIFASNTYGTWPRLHSYSQWFTASGPWHLTLGMYDSDPPYCEGLTGATIYVQNAAKQRVAGPIHTPQWGNATHEWAMRLTGKLRLDVVSKHCPDFSVRVDGVDKTTG